MMTTLIDRLSGYARVTVSENERVIALYQGRFVDILGPGEHRLPNRRRALETERHDLTQPELTSRFARALERERPDLVAEHLTVFAAAEGEVAVLSRDGAPVACSRGPKERSLYWTAAGPWTIDRFAVSEDRRVPTSLVPVIEQSTGEWGNALVAKVVRATVERGQVGLFHLAGQFVEALEPGVHWFWNLGQAIQVKLVDTRWQAHEVTGQEVLTADRVTIRVNLTAQYRVTDPVLAVQSVADFGEALHGALQLAFRRSLGSRTLDALLADKVSVDTEAADKVRREMAAIGIEVGEIALKDVILPGEMREILNRVVAAEKEAEANVIRRREETAATRALLNTAKVMAENPVMLRLKELEALQEIAGKVDRLTVHNGTQGLMSDLVRLTDERTD